MHVKIDFTAMRQDDERRYSPMSDGYRPGAKVERTLEFDLAVDPALDPKVVAEAVFEVTNLQSPGSTRLTELIYEAIYLPILAGTAPRIRDLSVGDTVTVDGTFLMCESVGFEEPPAPASPARTKALQILADVKPDFEYRSEVYPAQFARLMWPDSPAWTRISNVGHGATQGVGIKRSAGALLGKMEQEGLVRVRYAEHGQSFYSITRKGRQVLAFSRAAS